MQEIEVTGTIDQQGYIQLDHPLTISDRKNEIKSQWDALAC
jgi:hypothetical protein